MTSQRYDRRQAGDKPADNREAAQRDRDRILYSDAFRRLGGVTQVVGSHEGHTFHNRLSHSLKVAQVAQRITQRLARRHGLEDSQLSPDVVEAAALAHDLGHPPFGHVAEKELQRLVSSHDRVDSFEGNAQSFRIVTLLETQRNGLSGLNLTRATLRAILKYPWTHDPNDADAYAYSKWGAYTSERDDFCFALGLDIGTQLPSTPTPNTPPYVRSVEAQIMDWADDITYAVHDVEDFYRAGIIPLDRLSSSDDGERRRFARWLSRRWSVRPQAPSESNIEATIASLANFVPLSQPYDGRKEQRLGLRNTTSFLVSRYVRQAPSIAEVDDRLELKVDPELKLEVDVLKQLTWYYAIEQPALGVQQHGQTRVIRDLFEILFEATGEPVGQGAPRVLPPGCQERLDALRDADMDTPSARARIVADAICQLTEDQSLRLYRRLVGVEYGSVFDAIVV